MYEFWFHYVKPKHDEKSKLCDIDKDSYQNTMKIKIVLNEYRQLRFIISIKTDDIYKDIAEDVQNRFDTSNYELDHYQKLPKIQKFQKFQKYQKFKSLPKRKNKK